MDEKSQKLLNQVQRGQAVQLAAPLIFPLINSMIEQAVNDAVNAFRAGKTELTAHVAKIASLKELEAELQSYQNRGNSAYSKMEKLKEELDGTGRRT